MKNPHRKHHLTFFNLNQILNLLTVKAIMTPRNKFFYVHPSQSVSKAASLMREHKFSAAPLKEEEIRRYVKLEKLERLRGHFKYCAQVADGITSQNIISENVTIENIIEILAHREDSSPLFVTSEKSIVGLVAAADLDKIAVKVYFFTLISALESLLLEIIGKDYLKYKALLGNPRIVEKRCRKCVGEKVGLDEYNYLMTPEILEIVSKSDLRKRLCVKDDNELEELQYFRNAVAHGNYIIVNDADVKELKQKHDDICKYINALEKTNTRVPLLVGGVTR